MNKLNKKVLASFVLALFVVPLVASRSSAARPSLVKIPKKAQEVAPGVFSLGTAVKEGEPVQGYAFVHYKEGYHHKPGHDKGGPGNGGNGSAERCYAFLAKDAQWKVVEPWIVNAANNSGLVEEFVLGNLAGNITKWETAADGQDILGNGRAVSETLSADLESPDGQNEVYFADVDEPGAIAVTIVWGVFGGPPFQRRLVEWDQVYDDVDFDWSNSGESGKMDFENIATHELGHSVGLADLYEDKCAEQTMFGYADFGEVKKRSLELGDINGVKALY